MVCNKPAGSNVFSPCPFCKAILQSGQTGVSVGWHGRPQSHNHLLLIKFVPNCTPHSPPRYTMYQAMLFTKLNPKLNLFTTSKDMKIRQSKPDLEGVHIGLAGGIMIRPCFFSSICILLLNPPNYMMLPIL